MFTEAIQQARTAVQKGLTHKQYVGEAKQSTLIEYVETIILDEDAYNRLTTIMSKEYLK
ncbi:hypothetical protein pVco7_gp036 [Vibrio phage pVco-7]|uniref:Uncharacterized protein n=1 Tax=Vibrio phage pVco-5 TaxID=1965485 RepID=A0A1W6JUZ7_9CAUD|nr:hypothetical protein KNT61_gp037 [Vibrio phage pVco-5]ARM71025.1 hypothetical protein pVco5_037 [Vibrio phage pVco-5]